MRALSSRPRCRPRGRPQAWSAPDTRKRQASKSGTEGRAERGSITPGMVGDRRRFPKLYPEQQEPLWVSLTSPEEGATSLIAGRSTGRLRWVAAGAETRPGGETSVATLGGTNLNAQILLTPLTREELPRETPELFGPKWVSVYRSSAPRLAPVPGRVWGSPSGRSRAPAPPPATSSCPPPAQPTWASPAPRSTSPATAGRPRASLKWHSPRTSPEATHRGISPT